MDFQSIERSSSLLARSTLAWKEILMKCIRLNVNGTLHRVMDSVAHELVSQKQAVYIPKKEWKAQRQQ